MEAALGQRAVVIVSARASRRSPASLLRATLLLAVIAGNCTLMLVPPILGVLILARAIR